VYKRQVLIQPAYFLVSGIFPILSKKEENNKRIFWIPALILLIGALTVALAVWIFAPIMVHLLAGYEFEDSIGVLIILMVALIFAYLGHLVGFTLVSKEGQREMLGLGLMVMLFNFCGNLVAIPRFGIAGAATVTALTEFLSLILMSLRLKKRS
jgi:O-antigen/teichoic acid export membrane protein